MNGFRSRCNLPEDPGRDQGAQRYDHRLHGGIQLQDLITAQARSTLCGGSFSFAAETIRSARLLRILTRAQALLLDRGEKVWYICIVQN